MDTFLSEKSSELFNLHEQNLDEITVIIPNKRAAVYIQSHLAHLSKRPFFAPEMITINEWISQHTPEKILNQHELLFILFDVHRKIQQKTTPEKEKEEDFNEFLKWGKTMLSDFDEIDRYLVSPDQIFADLRNIKEIEHWSFNDPELSQGQEKYLLFWNQLHTYYNVFNETLHARSETYQGKAYQRFAETISTANLTQRHYYFLGFNALSASEEKIIHYLVREKRGSFHSDIDQSYYLNSEHEAAHFYRKLCQRWQMKPQTENHFNAAPKQITIIESAQQTGQAKIAGKIISELVEKGADLNSTAIVLADESLLIPLSQSLPQSLETANITMGYPLKYSHLKSLVDLIFDLQFNFQKFKNSKLYHKSLLRVLDHAYISSLIKSKARLTDLENHILEHNQVFIDWEEITQHLPELSSLSQVFHWWEQPSKDGFAAMNVLVAELYSIFKDTPGKDLELEMLYHFSVSFKKFEQIWNRYQHFMDLKSFKRMFYQFWQSESLSFLGNPTAGIQVMGILETRLLDFENLVILGMNEGNLPQVNVSNSFIPYDLKKHHQLPTEEDRQAIFAHHFYRLLHRAKTVYMTYNSGGDDNGNGEKSRYITQLENELDPAFGHRIVRNTYTPDDRTAVIAATRYPSVAAVHQKLDAYFSTQGLSPSALNKLVACPLDFYYRYILEMRENEQVEENIESSTFGTKIHDVLELIFRKNFLDKNEPLNSEALKKEKPHLEKYLREKYLESFTESEIRYGQNRLSFEVSLSFLTKFIDKQIEEIEKSTQPIFVKELEKRLELDFELEINGVTKKIRMSGLADRIDQVGTMIRIVDYKSGKCDDDKVVITESYVSKNELYKLMDHDKKGYARQLLMYASMYRANNPQHKTFSAGIISMININDWLQNVRVGKEGDPVLSEQLLDSFETELKRKIEALYQPDFFFEHNPDSQYCEHCEV
ncbi:MAG: PD-(D/E)XK nuclease family protein [Bacteroidetes bacterium]|nr:PD-(D/E)XK nuclease family protein [Bacteroidota bacterium]